MIDVIEEVEENLEKELNALDRCDRCGAQAYIQAVKKRQELLFCAHHGRQHTDGLVETGWVVLDSSHKLLTTP